MRGILFSAVAIAELTEQLLNPSLQKFHSAANSVSQRRSEAMKPINKLTQKLGEWFNKDSGESESPLLLQSLEDRVLYSAVPLPVDNVEAPVENTDLDDVQFIDLESNTSLAIGEAIAEDTSSQFLAQDNYSAEFGSESADATLEDLEELVNSFEQSDVVSSENDEPRTAMGLATATPNTGGGNFFTFEEGQSFTIDYNFLGQPASENGFLFLSGFFLDQQPPSGVILANGDPVEPNVLVTTAEIISGQVIFVPDPNFVGNVDFTLLGALDAVETYTILFEGVADDGVNVFGDEFTPVDGSAPAFEATTLQSETHVASLSDGGYVVVASLGDSAGQLQFQMFDDAGIATGSEEIISVTEFRVDHVAVVGLDDGEFLVAFEGEDGGTRQLNIQRFDASGQPVNFNGSQLQLTPSGNSSADGISLEYLGEDRFIVSYIRPGNTDIQSFVATIDGVVEEFFQTSASQAANDNSSVQTALLSDGGYVMARVETDGSTNSIFASTFDPGSHLQQQNIPLAVDTKGSDIAIVGTPDNGFAVVWQGTFSDPTGIYVATFDRLGNAVGAPAFIAQGPATVSATPDIVALDDGSFVVSHTAVDSNGTQEILGQRLNADLTPRGDTFTINSFSGKDQTDAEIVLLTDGTLVSTFKSGDQSSPATIFHQRLQMSVAGDEDTWIPLNSVVGIDPTSSTEVFETLELAGLPLGSKVHAGQLDGSGNLIVQEVFTTNQVLIFNPTDIGQLEFMAPVDASGTIEATATLTTNDGSATASTTTGFQVIVNQVIDAPSNTPTSLFTDEQTALTMTQAEFIANFIDTEGAAPDDLVNSISNVPFDETDFEDRIRNLPSPTSGISASFIFDGVAPLTAKLPLGGQSASFEFWIRSEDFSGNDRVIAQYGDANEGFTVIQRQDEVVLQFKSSSSEIVELSVDGLNGIQRSGSYDQIVVTFGTSAGDANALDAAIFLNGDLSESITDVKSIQIDDLTQTTDTLNLGQSGSAGGVGALAADNFGGELGLFRFESSMLDSDEVKLRYDAINNTQRIISINGQNLDSRDTIYLTTQENYIQSTLDVLPNGDFQFTPQPDFDRLTPNDTETDTLNVIIQRGAETFNTVVELNITGVNDVPVQQFQEVSFNRNGGIGVVSMNDFVIDPDGTAANPTAAPASMYLTPPLNGANLITDGSGFRLEIDPLNFVGMDTIDLQIGVIDANSMQQVLYDLTVNLVDEFEISGIVAHDRGIDGSIDGDQGFAFADVYLYQATNGLTDISAHAFVAKTETDASGRFVFDQNLDFDQEYFVFVDSLSVLIDQSDRELVWAQQTFASEGGLFAGASGLQLSQDAGYLIGGKESEISDSFWDSGELDDSQHIIAVSSSGNLFPLNELGFGFNFDVVNVVDNSDQASAINTEIDGQGTLNQFIHNANSVTGSNRMRFVPTTDANASSADGDQWWRIEIDELLPTIRDDRTVIDGRVFRTSDSGLVATNTGFAPIPGGLDGTMVGVSGDRIGEDDALLSITNAPALEITRKLVDDAGNDLPEFEYGIRVRGNSDNLDVQGVGIRNIAIHGFGNSGPGLESANIVIDGSDTANDIYNVSNFTLANNVIGADPFFSAVPEGHNKANNILVVSAKGSEIVTDSVLGLSRYSNQIRENVIGYADEQGIQLTNGAQSAEENSATSRWSIQSNQVSFNGLAQSNSGDGIQLRSNTFSVLIQENYINGNHAVGIDTFLSAGGNEILRNTIQNNRPQDGGPTTEGGGIRLFGVGNTVYGNSISDNAGAGVHVTGSYVGSYGAPSSFHNQILSNEFSNNDGISIDLSRPLDAGGDNTNPADYSLIETRIGDGVDVNDDVLDGFTGNTGLDSPEITSAEYDGNKMTVSFNPLISSLEPEDRIQIYLTENGVSHGEGSVLLGEVMATDLVNVSGILEAVIYPPSDRLPFDLTQEININATLTAFAKVTVNPDASAVEFDGYQTSEFSRSQLLEVNRPPTFNTVFLSILVDEGQTTVVSLPVADLDNDTITYSIVNERDGALFSVDNSGLLTFLVAPNFEAPNDSDTDNKYEVLVKATDVNGATAEIGVMVVVTNINELPIFTNPVTFDVIEGDLPVGQVTTTDPEADTVDYSIKTGTGDGNLFNIDTTTGNVSFIAAPDYENPNSASGTNTYTLTVLADDGNGGLAENIITVQVINLNEAPEISPTSPFIVNEGEIAVGVILASDVDGDAITFSVPSGILDSDLFLITSTGTLSFVNPPNFENPLDADGDNSYEVRVVATDENGAATERDIRVVVVNVNELPVFTNPVTFDVAEGDLPVGQLTTTDAETDPIFYTIETGTGDGDLFTIDATTGDISFIVAPDFENPNSTSGNNTYTLTVLADDGNGVLAKNDITVNVTDQNEAPTLDPPFLINVAEEQTAVADLTASDVDGDTVMFDLASGIGDSDLFQISSTGTLSFLSAPDFENQTDADGNNNYEVRVITTDEDGLASEHDVTVVVDDVNELPVFTNPMTFNVVEGNTLVGKTTVSDPENDSIVFSITPGLGDGDLFSTDTDGNISFILAPDYENPISVSGTNEYTLTVVADDGSGELVENNIVVNVTNKNESPVIGSTAGYTVTEGETEVDVISTSDVDGDTVLLSVVPGDLEGDLFQIAPDGTLSFILPPDFENPLTANGGNTYSLRVSADDQNGGVTERLVEVEVLNINEAPVIVADSSTFVDEGDTFVQTVSATDIDGDAVTLSIVDDGDPVVFTIDAFGNISFINTPDFEVPFDASGNNIDLVTILADDGNGGTSTQTVTVTLNDVNETPVFVGNNQQLLLEQDESSIETFDLVELFADPEDQSMTLEIVGGVNANLFHIVNNELALIDAPELVGPQSPTYEVQVVANDGVNNSVTETVNLKINNINDAPESSVNAISVSQDELADASFGIEAQDRSDADDDATSLEIAGNGADNSLFEIVNDRIQFIEPPTWENGGQNSYVVTTVLNDGKENSEKITFEITVDNINDRPEITNMEPVVGSLEDFQLSQVGPGVIVADLNQATTFDKDGDPVTFTLDSVGQDNNLFYIDGVNKLRFAATPNLEGVTQKDFNVSIVASDGQLNSIPQAISITVQNNGPNPTDDDNSPSTENNPDSQVITGSNDQSNQSDDGSGGVETLTTSTPSQAKKENPNQTTQRRNDINGINGINAASGLKTGDDDVFFDLTSDSVSYLYQFDAPGPQLVTQEIGDIMAPRHTAVDTRLEESMLANYFWQGFEDSEDEFIRKNLEADTTTIVAASAGLSLGLVSYLRLAAMATTVVTQLPAWKTLDVAPLISAFDEDEAETIHQIVDA